MLLLLNSCRKQNKLQWTPSNGVYQQELRFVLFARCREVLNSAKITYWEHDAQKLSLVSFCLKMFIKNHKQNENTILFLDQVSIKFCLQVHSHRVHANLRFPVSPEYFVHFNYRFWFEHWHAQCWWFYITAVDARTKASECECKHYLLYQFDWAENCWITFYAAFINILGTSYGNQGCSYILLCDEKILMDDQMFSPRFCWKFPCIAKSGKIRETTIDFNSIPIDKIVFTILQFN